MPKITIVVPVYNVKKYISSCVESLLKQSFEDLEVILVDDGSSDGSEIICDEYAEKDDRVRVIHKENGGVSKARNIGIENAKGQYIMFCDSDDYAEPDWCKELLSAIEKAPKSWCFCGCHCIDAQGTNIFNCVYHKESVLEQLTMKEYKAIYDTNYSALLWIRIFNMDIIKEHGIRFDENLSVSEDVLFGLEYGRYCNCFSVVNIPLYNHRMYLNNEAEHLDGTLPKEMFYLNRKIYSARKQFVSNDWIHEFATDFFYRFLTDIKGLCVNDGNTRVMKLKKISRILHSKEFRDAMKFADVTKENKKLILSLKSRSAIIALRVFS